ncbi:uncharacterized protein LOC112591502 [Melanaphis sacchari]|uniref:uncharacterized protein LOC112591502 n=1 Tax=Melanaphis sacchari TaxID=742174 RepID=UPI000DC14AD3|nr:uncharacterized protein LOC112591502 [Melanaphis sacchari]
MKDLILSCDIYLEYTKSGRMPEKTIQHIISSGDYIIKIINTLKSEFTPNYRKRTTANGKRSFKNTTNTNDLEKIKDICDWIDAYPDILQLYISKRSILLMDLSDGGGKRAASENASLRHEKKAVMIVENNTAVDASKSSNSSSNNILWNYDNDDVAVDDTVAAVCDTLLMKNDDDDDDDYDIF